MKPETSCNETGQAVNLSTCSISTGQAVHAGSFGRSTQDQEILPSHPRLRWWAVGSPGNFPIQQSLNLKDLTSDMFH